MYFRAFTKGNIINWDLADWDISNMQLNEINYSSICTGDKNELEVFYNQDFDAGKVLCKALGGQMNVITDAKNQNQALEEMRLWNCEHGNLAFLKICFYNS